MSARRKSRLDAAQPCVRRHCDYTAHHGRLLPACTSDCTLTARSREQQLPGTCTRRQRARKCHIARLTPRSSPLALRFLQTSRAAACPELRALLHRAVPGDGERAALLLLLPPPPPQVGNDGWSSQAWAASHRWGMTNMCSTSASCFCSAGCVAGVSARRLCDRECLFVCGAGTCWPARVALARLSAGTR